METLIEFISDLLDITDDNSEYKEIEKLKEEIYLINLINDNLWKQ